MLPLVFDTESEAREYSRQEALARGCEGTTTYWWPWRQRLDGRWQILDGTERPEDFDDDSTD